MDTANIRELAEILRQNDLTSVEVCEGDSRVTLRRELYPVPPVQPAVNNTADTVSAAAVSAEPPPCSGADLHEVKSPLVGVFYSASSPESAPFARVGDTVKKGQVLCIIEAMKLMNEIAADADGVVAEICLKDGDVAEFGQVLFKLGR